MPDSFASSIFGKKSSPILLTVFLLFAFVSVLELLALQRTSWHFCYPLDDTFIHMSIAKNLAQNGTWGITPGNWVSCSSSPLFTALVAFFFKIFSTNIYVPFVISMAGALLIIWVLNKELKDFHNNLSATQKTICLMVTLVLTVIPSLALLGMEPTLQIALTLLFVHSFATYITKDEHTTSKWTIALLGAAMIATRYENAIVVATACGFLLLRKQIKDAFFIGLISVLPVMLYGIFFYSIGGFPIPNSILVKANTNFRPLIGGSLSIFAFSESLGGLMIVAIVVLYDMITKNIYDRNFYILAIFIISAFLHSLFGDFGWFFRYESYLVVLAVFQLLILFFEKFDPKLLRQKSVLIVGIFFFLVCSNLGLRMLNALYKTPGAIHNIYDQQYQIAHFLRQYYNDQTVAANDIGAMSFFGDTKIYDLSGLANNEITKAKLNDYYGSSFVRKKVAENNIKVVIIYEDWFHKDVSENWQKVATWRLPYNVVCGSDTVTFFATSTADASQLKNNLLKYQQYRLPKENTVQYFW